MSTSKTILYGFLHALVATLYVGLVVTFIISPPPLIAGGFQYFGLILILLLFVISAAVMAMLIFGRPIVWYLNGAKKEAVALAVATVVFLATIAVAMVIYGAIMSPASMQVSLMGPPIEIHTLPLDPVHI